LIYVAKLIDTPDLYLLQCIQMMVKMLTTTLHY